MIAPTTYDYDPTTWEGYGEFTVTISLTPEDKAIAYEWLDKEHPLGDCRPIGHSLMQLIREDGEPESRARGLAVKRCVSSLPDGAFRIPKQPKHFSKL